MVERRMPSDLGYHDPLRKGAQRRLTEMKQAGAGENGMRGNPVVQGR